LDAEAAVRDAGVGGGDCRGTLTWNFVVVEPKEVQFLPPLQFREQTRK
jgi:hypothetical protein